MNLLIDDVSEAWVNADRAEEREAKSAERKVLITSALD